jgi:microcystin-dependent protein
MAEPFLGQIAVFPYAFAPQGWMDCAGQLLAVQQFAALFSLLGTQYGGNGTSNFVLPDLRGRVPVGQGQGPGLSNYFMGDQDGAAAVTITTAMMPSHIHSLNADTATSSTNASSGNLLSRAQVGTPQEPTKALIYSAITPDTPLAPQAIGLVGGNQPHNNMQPYLGLRYCIAIRGIFPQRP